MYKDDNMISNTCHESLLRAVLSGNGNQSPSPMPPQNGISENCGKNTWGIADYPLASVYAPLQVFDGLYDEKTALKQGTIFSELDLPFGGRTIQKGGNCRG